MENLILNSVIGKLAAVLGNQVEKEATRLFKVREEMEWVNTEMEFIQSSLEEAEARKDEDKKVKRWIGLVRDIELDLEDILDFYFPLITLPKPKGFLAHFRGAFGALGRAYAARNFVVQIEGIRKRIDDVKRLRETYGIQVRDGKSRAQYCSLDPSRILPQLNDLNDDDEDDENEDGEGDGDDNDDDGEGNDEEDEEEGEEEVILSKLTMFFAVLLIEFVADIFRSDKIYKYALLKYFSPRSNT